MAPRVRRPAEQARTEILDAAVALLREGGVNAVQMRAVAARVGMTDAGVAHHFTNRHTLLHELLRYGADRLTAAVGDAVARWLDDDADLVAIVEALAGLYRGGFSELALGLHEAGWHEGGLGLLEPLVQALHARRPAADDPQLADTRRAVAELHQAMALDPAYGAAFRRSAGIAPHDGPAEAAATVRWWADTLACRLGLDPTGRHPDH